MGIPKFFRYISERYPLISQLIEGDKIPEFDNFYLDFNSIIHACSHPNDADAHFRVSEEQIFTSIFAYVEHLFSKIRPKKLFFMAVDGVAPRAKMNQQRSRRFRTAREAREVREKAIRNGDKLPDEKAFDSNCITPGTPFMERLNKQLEYFVNKKVTEDANWRGVQVVLSGHAVPGEGEHKIMEYIRLSRAQEDYNPNIRHCLYGLDADLIMLGLLSHDPHFCLLREEVKFGPSSKKKGLLNLESQTFFLLHISLLREYLDLEFRSIAGLLPFEYDLERVIDDFVLLSVFVGNDFLPHLPDFHIHDNALERLFEIYKGILPELGGYLNLNGTIELTRLQIIMKELSNYEMENFLREHSDLNWYRGKQTKYTNDYDGVERENAQVLTDTQRIIFDQVSTFAMASLEHPNKREQLALLNSFSSRDREFIRKLALDLKLVVTWDGYNQNDENIITFRPTENETVDDEDITLEARQAVERTLEKYSNLPVQLTDIDSFAGRENDRVKLRMDEWKRSYYREKLGFDTNNSDDLDALVYRYVEGLQWVMYYYYSGVASWGWFYDYHYAPRISDITDITNLKFDFELGKPFRPFEQLMGVLPAASKEHIPTAYHDLMTDINSPILDFYPSDFEQDLNGKKQDWEAVVKIPFIDEHRLLLAMTARENRLSAKEVQRNQFGASVIFAFDDGRDVTFPSSLPGFLPDILHCKCLMEPFDLPTLDGLHLIPGLLQGVSLGTAALAGFPSLGTLSHRSELLPHGVNVFQSSSRNKSIVIYINSERKISKTLDIANHMVGKRIFINWPFLREGLVTAVSDSLFRYEELPSPHPSTAPRVVSNPHSPIGVSQWQRRANQLEEFYSKRCGVIVGTIEVVLHVRPLKGLKRVDSGALVKEYEGAEKETEQALQTAVSHVLSEDSRFMEQAAPMLKDEFPNGSRVFFLGEHAYGVAAQVTETIKDSLSVVLAFFPSENVEHEKFSRIIAERRETQYHTAYKVQQMLHLSARALSKITSSFMVITSDGQKINLGLSLKFEAKGLKVLNYSRKDGKVWEYSEKALNLIRDYQTSYPEVFRSLDRQSDNMTLAAEIFPEKDADSNVKLVKTWLKSKGVSDFEPVSLMSDQLEKETIAEIEALAKSFALMKVPSNIKKAVVKGIPRQVVLKPEYAKYKLQNQHFSLGDRVIMVQESGAVPLSAKGVVVGLSSGSMEVVWDVAFVSGTTLGNRCSEYHGFSVAFDSCLNLTNPQYIMSTKSERQRPAPQNAFKPEFGPRPAVSGSRANGIGYQAYRTPARSGIQILANPRRPGGEHPPTSRYDKVVKEGRQIDQHTPENAHTERLRQELNTREAHYQQVPFSNGRGIGQQELGSRGRGRGFAPRPFRGRGRGRG